MSETSTDVPVVSVDLKSSIVQSETGRPSSLSKRSSAAGGDGCCRGWAGYGGMAGKYLSSSIFVVSPQVRFVPVGVLTEPLGRERGGKMGVMGEGGVLGPFGAG